MENHLGYSVLRNFDYSQPFVEGVVNKRRKNKQRLHILSKKCLDIFLPSSDGSATTARSSVNLLQGEEDEVDDESTKQTIKEETENAVTSQHSANGMEGADEVKLANSSCTDQSGVTGKEDVIRGRGLRKRERGEKLLKEGKRPPPPPLVVFAYGGGWRRGDKQTWRHYISRWDINFGLVAMVGRDRFYSNVGESFASRGIPCAVLSYPLVPTPFPINLMEIGSSFFMSLAFTLLLTLSSCLALDALLFSMSLQPLMHKMWGFLSDHSNFPALSAAIAVIILSQLFTLVIIVSRELHLESKRQSDTNKTFSRYVPISIAFMAITTTVLTLNVYSLCSYVSENNTLTLSICGAIVVFVQYLVYHFQQKTTFNERSSRSSLVADPKGQAESVALALRWLVDYGRSTGHFDPDSIILMGHSAGGHLVSLVTLDHHYLTDVGICPRVIKGVITLSAIHDLRSISRGFPYYIYLKPAFGTDPAHWTRMSPIQYVNLSESENSVSNSHQSHGSHLPPSSSSSFPSSASSSSSFSSETLHLPLSASSSPLTRSSSVLSENSSSPSSASPPPTSSSSSLPTYTSSSSSSPPSTPTPSSSPPPSPSSSSSSSSSTPPTSSSPHRPHFLIISAAKDFDFMIEDSERMCSHLKSNGYVTKRNSIQDCNHFTMIRKFGCPWYRYWTGQLLRRSRDWEPSDGELICWEFVQQFWNRE